MPDDDREPEKPEYNPYTRSRSHGEMLSAVRREVAEHFELPKELPTRMRKMALRLRERLTPRGR